MKKSYFIYALSLLLGVSACAPKSRVLRAPSNPGQVSTTETNNGSKSADDDSSDKSRSAKDKKIAAERSIALLLPFQLDLIGKEGVQENDIKRSALALDFYQGFKIGLDELSNKSTSFNLKVIDSKDNVQYNSTLASSESVENSGLVVGPIYPIEIKAFGNNLSNKDKLMINPLAATPASEFGLQNLVTITPSIMSHTNGMAKRVAQDYNTGDIIIVYNTTDNDSRQFLNGMLSAIKEKKPSVNIISVSTLAQLNEKLSMSGSNLVISGTTEKSSLNTLINNLSKKSSEAFYSIKLYGHPLWDRFDFSNHSNFYALQPIITTESNYKAWTTGSRNFRDFYKEKFGIFPSDQSYKGYDVAVYFGNLINKYGAENLKAKLTSESYTGLFNSFNFIYNENWGFTNEAVSYKEFVHGAFQLQ